MNSYTLFFSRQMLVKTPVGSWMTQWGFMGKCKIMLLIFPLKFLKIYAYEVSPMKQRKYFIYLQFVPESQYSQNKFWDYQRPNGILRVKI